MDRTAKKTAANLLKLLREDGPTPIDSILKSYQARFRENLNMQGLGIHGSLAAGLLPGIVYRKQNNVGYLAAETTRRTGAAGGGLANSAEMANSRAKDPAVSGLLVVADLESYAAALEKFMLRTEKVTVKTLEQACAGRTVGLRVVQEDLDKTTGALTHIQVSAKSRQAGDASIAVCEDDVVRSMLSECDSSIEQARGRECSKHFRLLRSPFEALIETASLTLCF